MSWSTHINPYPCPENKKSKKLKTANEKKENYSSQPAL